MSRCAAAGVWLAQDGLEPTASSSRRACQPSNRSQICQHVPCSKFSSAARGRWRLSAREDVFVGAGAPKKAAGTCDKYDNTQLAEAIPEMQVA